MQNQGHVRHVLVLVRTRASLSPGLIKAIPMVIFLKGDISGVHEESRYTPREAMEKMRGCPGRLSLETVEELKRLFLGFKEHPPVSRAEHIAYVKERQREERAEREDR